MTIFEFHVFGFTIAPTYYGLAYALWILGAYSWVARRKVLSQRDLDHLLYAVVAGILLGGRLGYVLFYQLGYYLEHPLKILYTWEGGMSFHGGIVGVIAAIAVFSYFKKIPFLKITDEVSVTVPLGIFLGRIANYLNNELVGYAGYTGPFAMVRNGVSHFPSPLLESLMEWLVLWILLLVLQKRSVRTGIVSGVFLFVYGLDRIFIEAFFRLPDPQIGYLWGRFTLGQILSIPILLVGLFLILRRPNHS